MVILPRKLANRMLEDARSTSGKEICGLLGMDDAGAVRYIPIRNVAPEPETRYEMDPREQIDAFRSMRRRNERLFAIFHSHPASPPVPSETDLRDANYREALYFIASTQKPDQPELRCYRLGEKGFEELEWTGEQSR